MDQITDFRKIRSRQYMVDALLDLMESKSFEKITVSNIIQKAHVSRSTFYAQFEDKYFFLDQIIEDVLSELRKEVLPQNKRDAGLVQESHDYYKCHFEFIYKHARFFRIMSGPHGTSLFREKLEHSAYLTYQQIFMEFPQKHLTISVDYLIQYIVCAHIGITLQWIKGGLEDSPASMARYLTSLTFHGLLHGLEADNKIILPK